MESHTVKNYPELLSAYLGPNTEIIDTTVSKNPQGGFGSIMLKIDVKFRNENGCEETKHLVGKVLPTSEDIRKMFNIQVTYKNEVNFYTKILPTLRNFRQENGIVERLDFFADLYGARINLDEGSDKVTDDAILLLENLVELGFNNLKRGETFDLDTAKIILNDIAKFHGTTIGLKLKHPEVFNDVVKPACEPFNFDTKEIHIWMDPLKILIRENPQCAPFVENIISFPKNKPPIPREPYATMTHCDLWINNTMQKFENGRVLKNKIIDFQICDYRSCASDVFFFLWTSLQKSVVEEHLDHLIENYHQQLVDTLQQLKCDTAAFSLDKFYEELKIEAKYELGHAFMFAFGVRNTTISVTSADEQKKVAGDIHDKTPAALKEYLWFMIIECNKRGWL